MPTCTAPKLPPPASTNAVLVAVELFTADVLVADARAAQGLLHGEDHRRRSDYVIDGRREPPGGAAYQVRIDETGLPTPRAGGLAHLRHCRDQPEIAVLPLELLQLAEKRRVLGAAIRIEEHQGLQRALARRLPQHAHERGDAD